MNIQVFTFGPFAENTYVLYQKDGRAWIIDPGMMDSREEQLLVNFLKEKNLKPERVLLTHGHVDHVCGCAFLYDKYGLVPEIHPDDEFWTDRLSETCRMYGLPVVKFPDKRKWLKEEEEIRMGDEAWKIIPVPGHSQGSVAFYNSVIHVVISGDALFNGSIGRTDFPGGDYNTLIHSIRSRLFVLPDKTRVLSGHGPETTIGDEKKYNPFLQ